MRGSYVILVATLLLGGCSLAHPVTAYPNVMGAEMLSVINTDKTLGDHVMSWRYNQDCSTLRASDGGDYCQPYRKANQTREPAVYCYRTLGSTDCYTAPVATNQKFIGTNEKSVGTP